MTSDDLIGDIRFADAYLSHVDAVHGFVARRVPVSMVEELTAQTFADAYAHRDRFDPARGALPAWLLGIAANHISHYYRDQERSLRAVRQMAGRRPIRPEEVDVAALSSRVVADDAWPVVRDALEALPAGERDVLLLYAWHDLSYSSIAAVLDIPVGTVRSRMSRVRSRLDAALRDADVEWDAEARG